MCHYLGLHYESVTRVMNGSVHGLLKNREERVTLGKIFFFMVSSIGRVLQRAVFQIG